MNDDIMEEIDFQNGITPASAETMKAFQTNIKNAIISAINLRKWSTIDNTNITEGDSKSFSELTNTNEIIVVHESNNICLLTYIPQNMSGSWIKNQNSDIKASMNVNFSSGTVTNGGSQDTTTWIKKILYR